MIPDYKCHVYQVTCWHRLGED